MAWSSGANAALKIVVLIVLAHLLTPGDFGVVSAALIVVLFGSGLAQLGLGAALVQRPTIEPRHERTAFAASALFGLVVAAAVALGASQILAFFHIKTFASVIQVLALMFVIRGVATTSEFLLQREFRFRWLANTEIISYGLGYGLVGICLAALGWGVWALVAAQLAQTTIRTVLVVAARRPKIGMPSLGAFRDLFDFGGSYTVAHFAVLMANQIDNIVVVRWLGPMALGLYTRAYQLMAVPTAQLGDVLDNALLPSMARVQDDPERLAAAYLRGSALIALAMFPASIVFLALAPELIHVTLGAQWMAVVPPFQALALAMVPRTNYRMSDSLARAVGVGAGRVWRQSVYVLLVFAGALIGLRWGVSGVAWGVFVALFLNFLLMAHMALGVIRGSWGRFWRVHAPALWLGVVVGGAAWLTVVLCRSQLVPPVVTLVVAITVALAVTGVVIWRAPRPLLGPDGLWMLQTLRGILGRRFAARASIEMASRGVP